jgi:hypothetical protein
MRWCSIKSVIINIAKICIAAIGIAICTYPVIALNNEKYMKQIEEFSIKERLYEHMISIFMLSLLISAGLAVLKCIIYILN